MATGTFGLALGVANGGVSCPAGTKTLINSGGIIIPESGTFFTQTITAIEIFFTDTSVPTKLQVNLAVTINTVGGTSAANDGVMVIYDDVLAKFSVGDLFYLQQMYNNPLTSSVSDTDGFVQAIKLTSGTKYIFATYLTPTGADVTVGTSSYGSVGGGQSIWLHAAGAYSSTTDFSGGVEYNS